MQYLKLIPRPRLLGRLLFVVALTALLAPLPSGVVDAAEVAADPSDTADTRCVAHIVDSVEVRFNCYFDPVLSRRLGVSTARPAIMTTAGAGHVGIASWANNNSGASGYRSVSLAVNGGASLDVTSNTGFGFGAAAGLPAGAISFSSRKTGGHGLVAGSSLSLYSRPIFSGISCSSGSICQNLTAGTADIVVIDDPGGSGFWPTDWFPGGASAGAPIGNGPRCESVKIGVEYQGGALSVADYDSTFYPGNGQPGRDDFVFVATFTDWNIDDDPGAMNLEYRWPGNADWSPAFFNLLDSITFNGGDDSAVTFRVGSSSGRYLSQIQWRCSDTAESPPDRYLPFFDPGPSVNDPAWQLTAAYANPCEAIVLTRPAGQVDPGDTGRILYSLPTSTGLDLEVFAYGVPNFSPSTDPPIVMASSSALGVATGGPPPFDHGIAPGSGWVTFTLPATVDAPVSYSDLVFSCTDHVVAGVIVPGSADLGLSGSLGGGDGSGSSSFTACFQFPSMSLTSPASWVRGIGGMFVCLVEVLVLPDGDEVMDFFASMIATASDRPPFVVIDALIGFGSDVSTSFSSASGSGCFNTGGIPGVGASGEFCIGDGITVQSSQRSMISALILAPMLLGLIGHAVGLVREK